jgi:hypothetical protein
MAYQVQERDPRVVGVSISYEDQIFAGPDETIFSFRSLCLQVAVGRFGDRSAQEVFGEEQAQEPPFGRVQRVERAGKFARLPAWELRSGVATGIPKSSCPPRCFAVSSSHSFGLPHEERQRVFIELRMVSASDRMASILRQACKAAMVSDVTVLMDGETGTGKQVLARAIHDQKGLTRRYGALQYHHGGARRKRVFRTLHGSVHVGGDRSSRSVSSRASDNAFLG